MQDIKTLTLIVHRNNQSVLTKQIPAKWFPFVHQTYLNDLDNSSFIKVVDDQSNEYTLGIDPSEPVIDSQNSNQLSNRIYNLIQAEIKQEEETAKKLKELERILAEEKFKAEITKAKQEAETLRQNELRIKQDAENERKSQAELEAIFHQMVNNRQKAKAEAERLKTEYDLKIKTLTETLLPNLKNDPTTVLSVLESEIIKDEIVQIAVGEAITNSDEACRLVINSPQHLWNSNFIIMKAIILKVTYNTELAQLIKSVFPADHLLITMLGKVGRL